uniref:Fibrinogen-related protein n=1 Tax=Mytilus galloprovincialis TaxID=29158 RepID=E5KXF8_MYTGA|nr:fibrinogen-related protein [Mytilus galloprovincialis]
MFFFRLTVFAIVFGIFANAELPRECAELAITSCGVYKIYPFAKLQPGVSVYCKIDTSGHIWTVIQQRFDGSVNFFRKWQNYKTGFGQPFGEYWLGNDVIHELTTGANHALRIEVEDFNGTSKYAEYENFSVSSEPNKYRLLVNGYSGNAGDAFSGLNGQSFSTYDQDNDIWPSNCAEKFKGAWWYSKCHSSNLNGLYWGGAHTEYASGINWGSWGYHYSLQATTMMIRAT